MSNGLGKLFQNNKQTTIVSKYLKETSAETVDGIHSPGQLSESIKRQNELVPPIDYSDPANFVKFGSAELHMEAIGDVTNPAKFDLNGDLFGVGMLTQFNNGIYVRTEATAVSFDSFTFTGVGAAETAILEGNPTIATGALSLGYKF